MTTFTSSFFSFLRRAIPAAMFLLLAFSVNAQTLYRYVDADGRVVYTDKPPPPTAKDAQVKHLDENFIESDKVSASTRQAMERFPVTLYAFSCGTLCEDAEAMLQKRGIPYTFVDTQSEGGNEKLKKLTGDLQVPVLQVGADFVKGFNDASWQQALDRGGYSKDAGVKTSVKHTAASAEKPAAAATPKPKPATPASTPPTTTPPALAPDSAPPPSLAPSEPSSE
ncbi:MAG: glutaredoxin family protein [Burkholderiales bacterium]|nr:glutaredoxin family protein [Burkholderiales bacterium]